MSDTIAGRGPQDPFRLIFETAFQFIGLLDADGTMLEVNRSALAWVRTPREAVIGRKVWDTPWWVPAGPAVLGRLEAAVASARGGAFVRYDVALPSLDGQVHTFDFSLVPVTDEAGKVTLLVAEGRDITEQKRLEEALREANRRLEIAQEQARRLATIDELTGISNRRGFFQRAEQHKQAALRAKARGLLAFVDVDGLKRVNDEHGHEAGDALIAAAARLLKQAFRADDVVARLGGDEFAILAQLGPGDAADRFVERLQAGLDAHNRAASPTTVLRLSIGMHEFDWTPEVGIGVLLARADAAMYAQKRVHKVRLPGSSGG